MSKINIAIDGPSAAGKSTIAKILADQLSYIYIDTGAMYRCIAYQAKRLNIDVEDEAALVEMLDVMNICFNAEGHVCINDEDVSKEIRNNAISMLTSRISMHSLIREQLVKMQQAIASTKGYILDGRDIGTVVLPDAELKIYMVASVETRAQRRYKEYVEKQIEADYDTIYHDIEQRDYQDTHRKTSPLKKADDAVEIDTSHLCINEVVKLIQQYINQ